MAADPKHLGAQVGSLFVLHTWGQTLQLHPHVHGIITGLKPLKERDWVVYCQAPMAGPAVVLKYLARYSHRVAFGNSRLTAIGDETVSFTYKDYHQQARVRTMTLPGAEFLRRWLQHVLPRGFVRIRSCGLLANRHRDEKLARVRWLLLAESAAGSSAPPEKPEPRKPKCPHCGGNQWFIESRFGANSPPPGAWLCLASDTS